MTNSQLTDLRTLILSEVGISLLWSVVPASRKLRKKCNENCPCGWGAFSITTLLTIRAARC